MYLYLNGEIRDGKDVNISPFDRGFQFSDGVYEVIRYYPSIFFELQAHINRLKYSLKEIGIPAPPLEEIAPILSDLISKNDLKDHPSIVYIQISRGYQYPRRHAFVNSGSPTFFISVEKFSANREAMMNGVCAGLEEDIRWHRCDIKSTSLIPNVLSSQRAGSKGYAEIIYHRNGFITEGAHTNICFVKNNSLITPPLSNFILAGITRKIVLEICAKTGIIYSEENVPVGRVKDFDEILLLGTTTEITPVIEIDGVKVNSGIPGPVCRTLQSEYRKLY
ncbi:MAG: aminotransferase class IV [Melioribacteraceae bacterium]